jgi:SAM-dependent methyltransferase
MTLESVPSEVRGGPPTLGSRLDLADSSRRGAFAPSRLSRAFSSGIRAIARSKIFGKSPLGFYLRLNGALWPRAPRFLSASRPALAYFHLMHRLAHLGPDRRMSFGTFFLRNRPQLRLISRLAEGRAQAGVVRMAVLGCSLGAEVYSIRWSIASTYPDLRVDMHAVDISAEILEVARKGVYRDDRRLVETPIFERLTEDELDSMFDRAGGRCEVKPWLKEAIHWRVADASDPRLVDALGLQDIVVANDFLCHMQPEEAEACLRAVARLVDTSGYLVVSGVDVDVRTKVAVDLGWKPVQDSLEEIHDGDPVLRLGWPWGYWGLEPLDTTRPDWQVRYASVFQLGVTK